MIKYSQNNRLPIINIYISVSQIWVADNNKMTGFVSAEGLGANPDNLHFFLQSRLGYYNEITKLEDKNKVFEEKCPPDYAIKNNIEHL